jgi:putative spermidine/putrescine transport system substrate-binding protein
MFRKISVLVVTGVVASALAACGSSSDGSGPGDIKKGTTINVSTWGGVWTDAEKKFFGDPFTKETGIKVNYQVAGNSPMAPALLQAQSGKVSLDLVFAENAEVMLDKGLLADFPNDLKQVFAKNLREDSYTDNIMKMGTTATIIVCNPDVMKKCPTNPAEFWDVKNFPGPRAINNTSYTAMFEALVADGVAPEDVYPMDIDRAMKKLDEIKKDIKVFPSSGAEQQQVLIDKEVGAAIMWNGRAFVVKRDNIPNLELYWEGTSRSDADGLVVMKDAPHKAAAFKYLQWIAEHPENQAKWTEALTYPTPTKDLLSLISPEIAQALPTAHEENIAQDDRWIADHTPDLQKAWKQFLAG